MRRFGHRCDGVVRLVVLLTAWACVACASGLPAPSPGRSTLAGHVELRAPAPAAAAGSRAGAYGDRRMRDVERVDYSRAGFAVVYVDFVDDLEDARAIDDLAPGAEAPSTARPAELLIVDGRVHARFEPADLVLRNGGTLLIENTGRDPHLISIPGLQIVGPIAAGQRIEVVVDRAGAHVLHLLDQPDTQARIFSAPGPYARVSDAGRFAIPDLPPGPYTVHVWHPRMPPLTRSVQLHADTVERIDLTVSLHPTEDGEDDDR